jgi:hypothetical protein
MSTKTTNAQQPRDIIVTTPRSKAHIAYEEAANCIKAGGGFYFRTFRHFMPKGLGVGSRIFYVDDGFITGYATVDSIREGDMTCDTSGDDWGYGYHYIMPAQSWTWIEPIPMAGFQGFKYSQLKPEQIKAIGGWLDPKPPRPATQPVVPKRLRPGMTPSLDRKGALLLPIAVYHEDDVDYLRRVGLSVQKVRDHYKVVLPEGWSLYPRKPHPQLHLHVLDKQRRSKAIIINRPSVRADGNWRTVKISIHRRYCYQFDASADGASLSLTAYDRRKRKKLFTTKLVSLPTQGEPAKGARFGATKKVDDLVRDVQQALYSHDRSWDFNH